MNKSRIQIYLLIIQVSLIVFTFGGLTCWFRLSMSLEIFFCFVLYLALAVILLTPAHIIGLVVRIKKKNLLIPNVLNLIPTVIIIIASFGVLKFVSGQFIPPLEGCVIRDRPRQFIDNNGHPIEWWVEFVNPFDDNHRERLVLVDEKDKRVINMVLLARTGFLSTHKSDDDPNLKQLGPNLLLTSGLENSPHQTRFVLFDYESGSVISNWAEAWKPPNTESNQSVHSIADPASDSVDAQARSE